VLANITEFGATPLFTLEELRSARSRSRSIPFGVPRHERRGAQVYNAIRKEGTQKGVLDSMQTRADLYDTSTISPTSASSTNCSRKRNRNERGRAARSPRSRSRSPGSRGTRLCARSAQRQRPELPRLRYLDFADEAEFEEIAYLLVHEKLPTAAELTAYKTKLKSLRGLPDNVKAALEVIPTSAHRWT